MYAHCYFGYQDINYFSKFIMFVLSDFLTFTNFVYLGWVSFQFNLTSIKRTGSVASGGLLFDRLFFWKNLELVLVF